MFTVRGKGSDSVLRTCPQTEQSHRLKIPLSVTAPEDLLLCLSEGEKVMPTVGDFVLAFYG